MADCVKNFPTQRLTVDLSDQLKSTPNVIKIPMPNNGTEYQIPLSGVKSFILKPMLGNVVFGYQTGGPYFSEIPCGGSFESGGIDPSSSFTVYVKSDTDGDEMCVEYWT